MLILVATLIFSLLPPRANAGRPKTLEEERQDLLRDQHALARDFRAFEEDMIKLKARLDRGSEGTRFHAQLVGQLLRQSSENKIALRFVAVVELLKTTKFTDSRGTKTILEELRWLAGDLASLRALVEDEASEVRLASARRAHLEQILKQLTHTIRDQKLVAARTAGRAADLKSLVEEQNRVTRQTAEIALELKKITPQHFDFPLTDRALLGRIREDEKPLRDVLERSHKLLRESETKLGGQMAAVFDGKAKVEALLGALAGARIAVSETAQATRDVRNQHLRLLDTAKADPAQDRTLKVRREHMVKALAHSEAALTAAEGVLKRSWDALSGDGNATGNRAAHLKAAAACQQHLTAIVAERARIADSAEAVVAWEGVFRIRQIAQRQWEWGLVARDWDRWALERVLQELFKDKK